MSGKEYYIDLEDDFSSQKQMATRVTPDIISVLAPGQIFVFGSNLQGVVMAAASIAGFSTLRGFMIMTASMERLLTALLPDAILMAPGATVM